MQILSTAIIEKRDARLLTVINWLRLDAICSQSICIQFTYIQLAYSAPRDKFFHQFAMPIFSWHRRRSGCFRKTAVHLLLLNSASKFNGAIRENRFPAEANQYDDVYVQFYLFVKHAAEFRFCFSLLRRIMPTDFSNKKCTLFFKSLFICQKINLSLSLIQLCIAEIIFLRCACAFLAKFMKDTHLIYAFNWNIPSIAMASYACNRPAACDDAMHRSLATLCENRHCCCKMKLAKLMPMMLSISTEARWFPWMHLQLTFIAFRGINLIFHVH